MDDQQLERVLARARARRPVRAVPGAAMMANTIEKARSRGLERRAATSPKNVEARVARIRELVRGKAQGRGRTKD